MDRKPFLAALTAFILGGCSLLTTFNSVTPKDPAVRVARAEPFGDHARHRLDAYAPTGPSAKPWPVIVFFYGGGWYDGRREDYAFAAHALASRGFLVVVPDYRVYPEVTYPAFVEDGAQAVRWVQDNAARLGGDPSRILLTGHSAGGYNAVQLALHPEILAAAGVDPARIKGAAGLSGPYDFLPLDTPETRNAFGPYADLDDTQPINHVRPDAAPLFLAHGDRDTVVGLYHSENLAAALKAEGGEAVLKVYPGVDHAGLVLALSRPFRKNAPLLTDLTAFFRRAAEN